MAVDPEFFRTSDMAMTTYLKLLGHPVQGTEWDGESFYWLFRAGDPLLNATDDFLADEASVNPREFSKMFQQTKREFYDVKDKLTQAQR